MPNGMHKMWKAWIHVDPLGWSWAATTFKMVRISFSKEPKNRVS